MKEKPEQECKGAAYSIPRELGAHCHVSMSAKPVKYNGEDGWRQLLTTPILMC